MKFEPVGWSDYLSSNGDRQWVSCQRALTPLPWPSPKISAGPDTDVALDPTCVMSSQLVVVPDWNWGYSGGCAGVRAYTALGVRHCLGNLAVMGPCQWVSVQFTK